MKTSISFEMLIVRVFYALDHSFHVTTMPFSNTKVHLPMIHTIYAWLLIVRTEMLFLDAVLNNSAKFLQDTEIQTKQKVLVSALMIQGHYISHS